ncbi:hypothetical protein ACM1RC_21815 [Paenibacillus azoreducens]|uniref:hypothetical protein n=1 Tax=Paenibacillus azoreducens TaxID=116718 RepID=UPI0039F5733E
MLQVELLEELHLNPNAGQLSLYGSDSAGLTIYAYEGVDLVMVDQSACGYGQSG